MEMFKDLSEQLCSITGFDAMSLQPNSGASGEYAGLMAIRGYHQSRNDHHRNICIIPVSAHGTNPASAVMAGMKIVTVSTDAQVRRVAARGVACGAAAALRGGARLRAVELLLLWAWAHVLLAAQLQTAARRP
jgi:hypothetical protein